MLPVRFPDTLDDLLGVSYVMKHRVLRTVTYLLLAASVTALGSCTKKGADRKVTIPVSGQVVVDGQPTAMVKVECHPVGGIDKEQPTVTQAVTDKEGKFQLSTYEGGDGAPIGEYKLTFTWQEFNAIAGSFTGPDKLKGRYSDPNASQVTLKVEKGKAIDMGRIELSTR